MANTKKGIDIISIGDELLIGQVVNTNASWMAEKLNEKLMPVNRMISVADTSEAIVNALDDSARTARLILVTGGLGPTKDDITKSTICEYFGSELILNNEALEHVDSFFRKRGKSLTELNRRQAFVPDNCEVILNIHGTAPAMCFEKDDSYFVFMPGVPFEMKAIMTDWVMPVFSAKISLKAKSQIVVLTSGLGESFLADKVSGWENNLPNNTKVAYLPSSTTVRMRITVEQNTQKAADEQLESHIRDLQGIIPDLIYGYNDDTLEDIIGKSLTDSNKTISTAESCTGGLIANKITSVAGSSKYFMGSVVAYDNSIKNRLLEIDMKLIDTFGAVSEEVACAMAENVRRIMQTDYAISTTGIAGPDGGTEEKPVGTVWIGFASDEKVFAKKYQFGKNRKRNIYRTVEMALNQFRKQVL